MTEQQRLLFVALEDQVVSLVTSRKLEGIVIKGASIFVWEYYDDRCHGVKFFPYALVNSFAGKVKVFAAYTAAEILAMLPPAVTIEEGEPFNSFRLQLSRCHIVKEMKDGFPEIEIHHVATYVCDTHYALDNMTRQLMKNIHHENLAECLAQLLITLHEKGFMK